MKELLSTVKRIFCGMWDYTGVNTPALADWKNPHSITSDEMALSLFSVVVYWLTLATQFSILTMFVVWSFLTAPYAKYCNWKKNT
jgi:hypothetical protein